MYDLETLRYLNEQAHHRAIALSQEKRALPGLEAREPKVIKPPPVFPLSILSRKLLGGPPSLAYFIELLEQSEWFKDFLALVREYLPEHEVDIMAEDLDGRAGRFACCFNDKFFPLRDDAFREDLAISDLLSSIPVQLMGFTSESYHRFVDFRTGYILLLSLVECPLDEDYGDDDDEGEPGARIPILTEVGELVGGGLASLIPKKGWSAEDLHRMTEGTEFEGCGEFADWVQGNTGTVILDTSGDYSEMGEPIEWSPENVEGLTRDWLQASALFEKLNRVALLLEQDPVRMFRNLLAILLDKPEMVIPREQMPLPL